ncbi:MAG: intradiol ring-cleavage dioxygenase [Bradymonadia bacterium]
MRQPITRRDLLRIAGAAGIGATLSACQSDTESTTTQSDMGDSVDAGTAVDAGGSADAAAPSMEWAVGGTNLITVDYPPDDIFDDGVACTLALSAALTEGPCYYADDAGDDISAGRTGLPMQLCLRLVDADCQPLADHLVEIWHCDTRGLYSGDTSESADAERFGGNFGTNFCTGGDEDAESSTYYRGQLISDASGRVNFRSCFPGWYAGRTLHIHVAVSDPSGERRIVSQLCFTDAFVTEITTHHMLYTDHGEQDTPLASGRDMFFPSTDFEQFILSTQRNTDGTLLAWHSIEIA